MHPNIFLLDDSTIVQVFDEALQILQTVGVKVLNSDAQALLVGANANLDSDNSIVRLPKDLVLRCLETAPHEFYLYDANQNPIVHYGGNTVHFDPGSSGITVLDPDTLTHRDSTSTDLVRIIKIVEGLNAYDAQSTSVFCNEIPTKIQDIYRLFLVLLYSQKPIVTGALSNQSIQHMIDMLAIMSGGYDSLYRFPRAVFDVCPAPPLVWSNFAGGNLIALAKAGVPAEMVSVPLAGAASPVTLIGTVTQHTAECLAGLVIHQLASPGAPLVWGGAPTIFEMRRGGAPMGTIETAMLNSACSQVGKSLGLPTHGYLGGSDSKLVDVQAGLEGGVAFLVAALSGINMVSGAGMIDSLLCVSPEKLVIDAEGIAMARRFLAGISFPTDTYATQFYEKVNFKGGDFLKQRITINLFQKEQNVPGPVVDRNSMRDWQASGRTNAFQRAKIEADKLVSNYQSPVLDSKKRNQLINFVSKLAKEHDLNILPGT